MQKKIVKKENVYNGHFKISECTVEKDNGQQYKQELFERGNSVAALVYDSVKDVFVFTKQFRVGANKDLIEIVAGSMDIENETPEVAMEREINEELGYDVLLTDLEYIGSYYVSPGGTSEKIHLFFVQATSKISSGGGLEDEDIDVVELTKQQLISKFSEIEDAKTAIALFWLQSSLKLS